MVASEEDIRVQLQTKLSFNPLHCGAVVASRAHARRRDKQGRVSIPFIAGQWSLPAWSRRVGLHAMVFQSPSLRGSGRFQYFDARGRLASTFQSPSLRGSGRFGPRRKSRRGKRRRFQSPSLRGSGRFQGRGPPRPIQMEFQSPSLRGSGRFPPKGGGRSVCVSAFQSPSLRGSGRFATSLMASPTA